MGVIIGIDIGGSTTKIVGFDAGHETKEPALIEPIFVKATDPITSIYGAFGKFTSQNNLGLSDIEKIMVTGVGASFLAQPIYGCDCEVTPEFKSIGIGGLYLSGLNEAVIGSLGTGTAFVHAKRGIEPTYLGGTGMGGGTLMGLARKILNLDSIEHIEALANDGNIHNVDLKIKDITKNDIIPGFADLMTASNFGNLSDIASKSDIALGLLNMVFETIGMVGVFAARNHGLKDIVLTGNLTQVRQAKEVFDTLNKMFSMNFTIPKYAQYATVIGAALSHFA